MIWYKLEVKKPIATEKGCWDGLKSGKVLVCTHSGKYDIAEMYEGTIDGSYFCDFYNEDDYEVHNVKYWTEIDSPF